MSGVVFSYTQIDREVAKILKHLTAVMKRQFYSQRRPGGSFIVNYSLEIIDKIRINDMDNGINNSLLLSMTRKRPNNYEIRLLILFELDRSIGPIPRRRSCTQSSNVWNSSLNLK